MVAMESSFLRRSLLPRCCFSDASKVFDGMPQPPPTTCVEKKKKKKKNAMAALLAGVKRLVRRSTDANTHKEEDPAAGSVHTDKIGNDESTIPHLDTKEAPAGPFLSPITADSDGVKISNDESGIPHLDTKEVPAGPLLSLVTADQGSHSPNDFDSRCLGYGDRGDLPHAPAAGPWICGHRARLAAERHTKLQCLSLRRAVSGFPHRNRIHPLLPGRFLRNGDLPEEERRQPLVAARELGQLRQRHPDSGLRLENLVRGQAASRLDSSSTKNAEPSTIDHSESSRTASEDTQDTHQHANDNLTEAHEEQLDCNHLPEVLEELHINNHVQKARREWIEANDPTEDHAEWQSDDHFPEVNEVWHDDDEFNDTAHNWHDDHSEQPVDQESESVLIRGANTFTLGDDDNVYSTELRELLSRRSVSNLLDSAFRENLDQLIRSYVERQGRGPLSLNLEGTPAAAEIPDPQEQGQEQNRDDDEEQELLRAHFPEVNEVWHDGDELNDTAHNWHDDHSEQPVAQESALIRGANTFNLGDDDNVYSTELRELLSRRSVSNLLDSAFRGNLDRLIRSYVERQGHGPLSLNLEGTPAASIPDSPEQGQEQHGDDEEQELRDANVRPRLVIPHPHMPPRQPVLPAEAMHEYLFIYC